MIRIDTYLRNELKKKAKADGRTLEWMLNKAVENMIVDKTFEEHDANIVLSEIMEPDQEQERPMVSPPIIMERVCCAGRKPCQHWAWNGESLQYINTLSGRKIRDAEL